MTLTQQGLQSLDVATVRSFVVAMRLIPGTTKASNIKKIMKYQSAQSKNKAGGSSGPIMSITFSLVSPLVI